MKNVDRTTRMMNNKTAPAEMRIALDQHITAMDLSITRMKCCAGDNLLLFLSHMSIWERRGGGHGLLFINSTLTETKQEHRISGMNQ